MMNISMKHLRYFEALARHQHFGHAAEACRITQPALSLQMKELEEMLGAALIERGPKRIRLTSLGEDFVARAREILRAVDELGELARASGESLHGRFRLGVIPTVAPYLLPAIIQLLARHHPRLDLRPREATTRKLLADLNEGRLDAAIMALPVSEPLLHEEPILEEEFMLVRPLADAGRPVPDSAGLREMRLLLLEEGHCFRDQALSFCNMPAAPSDLMEGSSLSTLVQMVGAGIGVTLVPQMAIPLETASASVSVARLREPRPRRTLGLVWRRNSPLARHLGPMAAHLQSLAGQGTGRHPGGAAAGA
ncbi:LysR substrate-binding domain-containing protein [Cereibacter azotoformans]|uniref:LysR family hydrogen peroxide-inducible transcriptional activator n=1 Tax=Cereibacter azotoformans TaxID=43057 RepID=A0A2T5K9Y8_9RHOB|nr:hydrogen peroxide-inducible genes activator [Cereibacter azotoformans]AXQ95333.1 hydrogen peroxide-inducible genes activator [Cereibacter sphaeroides]PTR19235.1 LysR family hydrogen peroxide-inducible transcriptional activator [Cereibacter azotoformans]UIJ32442.1 LysR substrate-binding domain-containing protein [Cereibacter azotoformans]